MLSIDVANEQELLAFDEDRLKRAAEAVLRDGGVDSGSLSIAVVDDAAIQVLNRRYLEHDYPTDVLSFALDQADDRLEGEVVVSAETAIREAGEFGWTGEDELLLYVIHGTLHLVGYDDTTPEARHEMYAAQRQHLSDCGLEMREQPAGRGGPAAEDREAHE